mgnify:CR=1 FL=1
MVIYLILSLLLIAADQVMKMWIFSNFALHTGQELLPGIVKLFYIQNTGAAWGILAGQQFVFYLITAFGVSAILYLMFQERGKSKFALTTYSLLLAGALGNFIDRVLHGEVVDFIDTYILGYDFPIFNVADSSLTIGVILIIIALLTDINKE